MTDDVAIIAIGANEAKLTPSESVPDRMTLAIDVAKSMEYSIDEARRVISSAYDLTLASDRAKEHWDAFYKVLRELRISDRRNRQRRILNRTLRRIARRKP